MKIFYRWVTLVITATYAIIYDVLQRCNTV